MPRFIDLTGTRFGNLVAERVFSHGRRVRWLCRCDCGQESAVIAWNLTSGLVKSCGCARNHGHRKMKSPTYSSWVSMLDRCVNERSACFHKYGGRGITVCERWRTFTNFLQDMGERPEGTSLDRYPDQRGNYEPGNCRWATPKEQGRNTCTNRVVTYRGITGAVSEVCERLGIENAKRVRRRLRDGWPPEVAFADYLLPRGGASHVK